MICELNIVADEVEAYGIELANELIGATRQVEGVEVVNEALV